MVLRISEILNREFSLGNSPIHIEGSSSAGAVAVYLDSIKRSGFSFLPHIVIVDSLDYAEDLEQQLKALDSKFNVFTAQPWDVGPFSQLSINKRIHLNNQRFLFELSRAKENDIFVLPALSSVQKVEPASSFSKKILKFKVGEDFLSSPEAFFVSWGFESVPMVEFPGQFSIRGGIVDVFSPAHDHAIRIELFGDQIESLKQFSPLTQRTDKDAEELILIPCSGFVFSESSTLALLKRLQEVWGTKNVNSHAKEEVVKGLNSAQMFPGLEFCGPFFWEGSDHVFNYCSSPFHLWTVETSDCEKLIEDTYSEWGNERGLSQSRAIDPELSDLFFKWNLNAWTGFETQVEFSALSQSEASKESGTKTFTYRSLSNQEVKASLARLLPGSADWQNAIELKLQSWTAAETKVFICCQQQTSLQRISVFLKSTSISLNILPRSRANLGDSLTLENPGVYVLETNFSGSLKLPEDKIVILNESDLLGRKTTSRKSSAEDFHSEARKLSFGDLKPLDLVVHTKHGVGVYEGLKLMMIGGAESEFLQIAYKDKDKLYLPVYRIGQIQKYSGPNSNASVDRLGGTSWEKSKTKVKSHVRDIAADLLKLYAQRSEVSRPSIKFDLTDYEKFSFEFPYTETDDQLRAIKDIENDFRKSTPMDRLICGDVGFGKTEVAMRAAFSMIANGSQVAVLAPTTVLTFQHFETFKERFKAWPYKIAVLNRFISTTEQKSILKDLGSGKIDLLIGTHRILSKDIEFKKLGLLIIDEEQKFGVLHKERIKKFKSTIDTLTLSATPIPRTLNMSLVGIRDLSLINTAPTDRLPTRTYLTKWDEGTIRKAIQTEVSRGGQIYFIHNRVESIFSIADELRAIAPEVRIRVAHGQMEEHDLEKAMIEFFNHEIDMLVCTSIVESGMDVSRANTMFIDQPQILGLSQLYQLRGRVGRSKQRAYCYLILPRGRELPKDAQERLKVLQENTALGSGLRIAQYDLELRGTGNFLGEEQSGHINAVGYELYMDLLNEALADLKGEAPKDIDLDPEINLRVPAFIPDAYISDIRTRLMYYKTLSEISSENDLTKIEEELKDQFGSLPEPVINLMGIMLIRSICKTLGIKDVSAGTKQVTLNFSERTKFKPETAIRLSQRSDKKYTLSPDNRFSIKINSISWPRIVEELEELEKLI